MITPIRKSVDSHRADYTDKTGFICVISPSTVV